MIKFLILLISFALSACAETSSTKQNFDLSSNEIIHLEKQAVDGDGEAAFRLGHYYNLSKSDYENALIWYRLSAQNNNVKGMYNLGMFLVSTGGNNNFSEGKYWLEKAASFGDSLAQAELGFLNKKQPE